MISKYYICKITLKIGQFCNILCVLNNSICFYDVCNVTNKTFHRMIVVRSMHT